MDVDIKKQIIKSVRNIKNKLKILKEEEDISERKQRKILKPITDPLESIVSIHKNEENKNNQMEASNENNDDYFSSCTSDTSMHTEDELDDSIFHDERNKNITYGIRNEGGKVLIGNVPIVIKKTEDSSVFSIKDKSYVITPGLSELLFENKPKIDLITEQDRLLYKDILIATNAHRRGFIPSGQIQGNSGIKYSKIIKPLFLETETKKVQQGGSLPILKKYKSNTDLVYWDNPNELIDRLKLLVASKSAGNTNHDNEIISIIEELKEAGIIRE